jgi:O-acetyl-ADP-ribose deacetylase (regulator of RNase III)
MIKYIESGNLFDSKADALVNTVNCKGIMGKGVALEFKKRFPFCFSPYKSACRKGILKPGDILYVKFDAAPKITKGKASKAIPGQQSFFGPPVNCEEAPVQMPIIIHLATKDHWRGHSQLEWINKGMLALKKECTSKGLHSIAMPTPGCGLGGLRWLDVKPIIEKHFFNMKNLTVEVYLKATNQLGEV